MAFVTKSSVEVLPSHDEDMAKSDDGLPQDTARSPDNRLIVVAGATKQKTEQQQAPETKQQAAPGGEDSRPASGQRVKAALYCPPSSYGLATFVGVLTYVAYASLNSAWFNPALFGIAVFLLLTIPLYSKLSNRIEFTVARWTGLETGGRIARYILQLLDNLLLLWMFVAGQVVDPAGLEGIGGFFATAAWITIVSQGGQYLANWLARKGVGDSDRNVVLAISISAIINALAVSGVTWIQPVYVGISLCFGMAIFGLGLVIDARFLYAKSKSQAS